MASWRAFPRRLRRITRALMGRPTPSESSDRTRPPRARHVPRTMGPRHRAPIEEGTRVLLPSLGFFGSVGTSQFVVRPAGELRGILIRQTGRNPRRLNLRGVQFTRGSKKVKVDLAQVRAEQSSTADAGRSAFDGFELGEIRTQIEVGAWWAAEFDPPLTVDKILLLNRASAAGVTSHRLQVMLLDEQGCWQLAADPAGEEHRLATLALLERLTGTPIPREALTDAERAASTRATVLTALAGRARREPLTRAAEEQRLLFSLLPVQPGSVIGDDEMTLLAHLLIAERVRAPRSGGSLRSFQSMLPSRDALHRLAVELEVAATVWQTSPSMVTRHGLRDHGTLRRDSARYLELMDRAVAEFEQLGLSLMLGYGTLLGAVREGDFLAHDDDVDLIFALEVAGPDGWQPALDEVVAALRSRGWAVWTNPTPSAYNCHIRDPRQQHHIDIFPVFLSGNDATLHMEHMALRTIDADLIRPHRHLDLHGHAYPVPADPEGFLAERYGPTWDTPDPFHDWPWKLL